MKTNFVTLTSIVALSLAGCQNTSATSDTSLTTMSLAGSEWSPQNMTNMAEPPFIQFRDQGQFSGFGGCNRLFGSYTQDGEALTIGPVASTKMMCQGAMDTEQTFINALSETEHANISHLRLDLINADGELLMTLVRRDPD